MIQGRVIVVLVIGVLSWPLQAQSDRTATGTQPAPKAPATQASSITQTSYFGENTTDARDHYEEFNTLYRRFSQNPKLSGSKKALERALAFFVKNKRRIPDQCGGELKGAAITNQEWIVITDYTKPLDQHRQFYLNLKSGEVLSAPAAHGYGSNKNCPAEYQINCGAKGTKCEIPATIADIKDRGINSRGFYLTDGGYASGEETFRAGSPKYQPGAVNGIYLKGLLAANQLADTRAIVFHRASYVGKDSVNRCSSSAGCPSTDPHMFEKMKEALMKGTLFYSHTVVDEKMEVPDC